MTTSGRGLRLAATTAVLAAAALTKPGRGSFKRALARLLTGADATTGGGVRGFLASAGLSLTHTVEGLLGVQDEEKVIKYSDFLFFAHVHMDRELLEAANAGIDSQCWENFLGVFGYWLALKYHGEGRGVAGSGYSVSVASATE